MTLDADVRQETRNSFRRMAEMCAIYRDELERVGLGDLVVPVVSQWAYWMLMQAGAQQHADAQTKLMREMLDTVKKMTGEDEEEDG